MNFGTLFRVLGPRALGIAAGWISTKLAERGVTTDPATLIALGTTVYATVHKAVSSKVNPGDAASGRVATAEKKAADFGTTVTVAPPAR